MIKSKYQQQIKEIITKHSGQEVKIFIYGSSVNKSKFNDVDVGIMAGDKNKKSKLFLIREELENSNIPFKIEVVDFNNVNQEFKNKILNQKEIIWLT